jgi:hypothetical protein
MSEQPPARTREAVLLYALGRWQTAFVVLLVAAGIAATILALGFNAVIISAWVLLGVAGIAGMIVVSFRDERSVDEALEAPIDLGRLHSPSLREQVERARTYREAIRKAVFEIRSPELRSSLAMLTRPSDDPAWLIYTLARRIEAFRDDRIIQDDLTRLRMSERGGRLTEPERSHLDELNKFEDLIEDAGRKIDATLSQLGASYAEIQTIGASGDIRGGRVQMALDEIKERSTELSELGDALDEMQREREARSAET